MNDIVNSATNNLQNDAGDNALSFAESVLKTTRGMTGPQAGVAIVALGAFSVGACYVLHEVGVLVKGGYVESIDLECRKINFNRPNQVASE